MSTKPYNEQTRFEKFMDHDLTWRQFFILITLLLFGFFTCGAQTAPDSTKVEKPAPKIIPVGQTFASQINQLMKQQQQINAQISYLIAGIRDQAGIDTSYKFAGFTEKGQAVYVIPEPKKVVK